MTRAQMAYALSEAVPVSESAELGVLHTQQLIIRERQMLRWRQLLTAARGLDADGMRRVIGDLVDEMR